MQIPGGVANNPAAPTHVYQGFNNRRGARRLFLFYVIGGGKSKFKSKRQERIPLFVLTSAKARGVRGVFIKEN